MKNITTLDELLPLVAGAENCKDFGAIIIQRVPQPLKHRLARQARDTLGRAWSDGTVRHWLKPGNHTEERAERQRALSRKGKVAWRAIPENREAEAAWYAEYCRNRRQNDPAFKIANNLRSRLWEAVKAGAANKSASTLALTGCAIEELMQHIEAQFAEGMSWENYGLWHVDHRVPCNSWDLTDEAQQRICFHFTNLQPLWAKDNRSKGDKLDWAAE